jgi:hypothetical protein
MCLYANVLNLLLPNDNYKCPNFLKKSHRYIYIYEPSNRTLRNSRRWAEARRSHRQSLSSAKKRHWKFSWKLISSIETCFGRWSKSRKILRPRANLLGVITAQHPNIKYKCIAVIRPKAETIKKITKEIYKRTKSFSPKKKFKKANIFIINGSRDKTVLSFKMFGSTESQIHIFI